MSTLVPATSNVAFVQLITASAVTVAFGTSNGFAAASDTSGSFVPSQSTALNQTVDLMLNASQVFQFFPNGSHVNISCEVLGYVEDR